MATDLRHGESMVQSETLNSCAAVEGATYKNETKSLSGIESMASAETMIGPALAQAGAWAGTETILLVEDEAFVRKATAEVLESAGYKLVIAGSAAEALEAYCKCSDAVDLLLADVVMPGMSGRELATEFTSLHPRGRVLLMSGYAEQLALSESSLGGKNYLAKPFSMPTLLQRVREVLGPHPFELGAPV